MENEFFNDDSIEFRDELDKPGDCRNGKRYRIKGLKNRDQYVIIDDQGIMITFPDNKEENLNYQATATALTRIMSIAQQAGISMGGIKKQLEESSMQKHDTPYILLEAIKKYENK